ncbi:MAG: hypothetical protein JWR63_3755 [Conexibacter sp.]|nr:hypothetical protein [Conexibacter sp.]
MIYSAAFQRLAYVTQVTAPESGHTFHNRLSHSLKVAQVGRRNAERLLAIAEHGGLSGNALDLVRSLDPDCVEASCLGHDLGHPPFGHIAEEVLNNKARAHVGDDGGFEGNAQSFRIVTRLAQRASGSGMNLTRQTLDGLLKYPWKWRTSDPLDKRERKWGYYLSDRDSFDFARADGEHEQDRSVPEPCLEALIMEWADDLTYAVHDVDDFYRAGLIPLDRLGDPQDDAFKQMQEAFAQAEAADPKSWPQYPMQELVDAVQNAAAGYGPSGAFSHTRDRRREMRHFGSDLITRYLSAFTIEDDQASGKVRVKVEPEIEREVAALKLLVRVFVILRPGLAVVQHGQQRVIEDLFDFYFEASEASTEAGGDRRVFPPGARRVLNDGPNESWFRARVVTDLLSGLTESTAIQLHQRIAGGWTAPTLDATALIG